MDNNTAAVKALELFKINAKLCDLHPSKREPDTLRPDFSASQIPDLDNKMSSTELCPTKEDFSGKSETVTPYGC